MFRNYENCPNGSAELAVKSFVCPDTFTRMWSIRLIFMNSYLIGIILFQACAYSRSLILDLDLPSESTDTVRSGLRTKVGWIDRNNFSILLNQDSCLTILQMKHNKSQFHSSSPAAICHHPTSRYSHRTP